MIFRFYGIWDLCIKTFASFPSGTFPERASNTYTHRSRSSYKMWSSHS